MTKIQQITISDRNALAFYIACGHQCEFISNNGRVEGTFQLTPEFKESQSSFMQNRPVPVQSFIAASKLVASMIWQNRKVNA